MKRYRFLIPGASIFLIALLLLPVFLDNSFMSNSELAIIYFIAKGSAILLFITGFLYIILSNIANNFYYILSLTFSIYQLVPLGIRLIIKYSAKPIVWSVILLIISIFILVLIVGIIIILNDKRFDHNRILKDKKKTIEKENKNQQIM